MARIRLSERFRALALLARGKTIGEAVDYLHAYHQRLALRGRASFSREKIQRRYFPRNGVYFISDLVGADRKLILRRMRELRLAFNRKRRMMKALHRKRPELGKAAGKVFARLNESDDFRAVSSERTGRMARNIVFSSSRKSALRERFAILKKRKPGAFRDGSRKAMVKLRKRLAEEPELEARRGKGSTAALEKHTVARRTAISELFESQGIVGAHSPRDSPDSFRGYKIAATLKTPLSESIARERTNLLSLGLSSLPSAQRKIIEFSFNLNGVGRGLSDAEISSRLRLSVDEIRRQRELALKILRKNKLIQELR